MKRALAIAACIALITLGILFWGSIDEPATQTAVDQQPAVHQPAPASTSPPPPQTAAIASDIEIEGYPVHLDSRGNL